MGFCINTTTAAMGADRNFPREGQGLWDMARAESESITGVMGQAPWS